MKAIIISQEEFEKEKKATLDKLELINLKEKHFHGRELTVEQLHRAFHYEVCNLMDRLAKL